MQPARLVGLASRCGDGGVRRTHHWGRELTRQGHTIRLIPPIYVKPFVKRQKNDMADAEAICEAAPFRRLECSPPDRS